MIDRLFDVVVGGRDRKMLSLSLSLSLSTLLRFRLRRCLIDRCKDCCINCVLLLSRWCSGCDEGGGGLF